MYTAFCNGEIPRTSVRASLKAKAVQKKATRAGRSARRNFSPRHKKSCRSTFATECRILPNRLSAKCRFRPVRRFSHAVRFGRRGSMRRFSRCAPPGHPARGSKNASRQVSWLAGRSAPPPPSQPRGGPVVDSSSMAAKLPAYSDEFAQASHLLPYYPFPGSL